MAELTLLSPGLVMMAACRNVETYAAAQVRCFLDFHILSELKLPKLVFLNL